ncbi:MAG: hypothetical protein U1A78_32460 [Polyangia bacterium]
MEPWTQIGKHLLRIEQDVVFIRVKGEITAPEIVALLDRLVLIDRQYGRVFEIVDAREAGPITAATRHENAQWYRNNRLNADLVVYNASLVVRTVFTLFMNALRLFDKADVNMHFVATEAEAVAWVAERRKKLKAATAR